eukprot:689669-Amphidinium_carterae.1
MLSTVLVFVVLYGTGNAVSFVGATLVEERGQRVREHRHAAGLGPHPDLGNATHLTLQVHTHLATRLKR